MILVDTSVWVDHLRTGNARLGAALDESLALTHPFVIGELACGNLKNRSLVLENLRELPPASPADDEEVFRLVEDRKLWGLGIGWVDAHLIAAARLTGCELWTLDRRLSAAAAEAGVKVRDRR